MTSDDIRARALAFNASLPDGADGPPRAVTVLPDDFTGRVTVDIGPWGWVWEYERGKLVSLTYRTPSRERAG